MRMARDLDGTFPEIRIIHVEAKQVAVSGPGIPYRVKSVQPCKIYAAAGATVALGRVVAFTVLFD